MIKTFKSQEEYKVFYRFFSRKLPLEIQRSASRKLHVLHGIGKINDLRVPRSNHLEKLIGNRNGQYSIRINEKWRICFDWRDNNAYEVEITDYH